MAIAKHTSASMSTEHDPSNKKRKPPYSEKDKVEGVPFCKVFGCLLYFSAVTHPDIGTTAFMLGKFQVEPLRCHWKMTESAVRYICETTDYEILLPFDTEQVLFGALRDADWTRDKCKQRSYIGCLLCNNNDLEIWTSELQTGTALSVSVQEFAALSTCVQEVI